MKTFLKAAGITLLCLLAVFALGIIIEPGKYKTVDMEVTFDPVLGWSPDWYTPEHDGPSDETMEAVLASKSFGQRKQRANPDSEYIVLIGDSVMFGTGLRTDQLSSSKLEPLLSDVEVFNMSVTGYSIDQYFLYLQRHLPKLSSRVVVVGIYSENDFSGTIRNNQYGGQKPLFIFDNDALIHTNPYIAIDNCLNTVSRSAIFHALWRITHPKFDGTKEAGKTLEDAKRQARREGVNDLVDSVCEGIVLDYQHGERVTRALLDKIVELSAEHGAKTLFLILPGQGHFTSPKYLEHPPDPRLRFFQRIVGESGHPHLDFYEYIKGTPYFDPSCMKPPHKCAVQTLYLDGGHFTEEGHELMAKAIAEELIDRGWAGQPEKTKENSIKGNPDGSENMGTPAPDTIQ